MKEDVKNRIKDAAAEIDGQGRLPCKRAFQLAEELNLSLKDIGDICNAEGIKIIRCQLGCFP
jgi:hypothetical protein